MTVTSFQKKCYNEYKESIKFPEKLTYLYGNPVNPVVPVETAMNQIMVVGDYPSARFYTVKAVSEVPLYDIGYPFSLESYFDGLRFRSVASGHELNEIILENIGVRRQECWITNLVKVFLFKKDHVKRYSLLGKSGMEENRHEFAQYARRGLNWFYQEVELANPYLIILLGTEVVSAVFGDTEKEIMKYMNGKVVEKYLSWKNFNIMCLPDPTVLMSRAAKNPWPLEFEVTIAPNARKEMERIRNEYR